MRFRYTDEHLNYLRSGYRRWRVEELTRRFNAKFGSRKTARQIRSTLKNHKIASGRPPGLAAGERRMLTKAQEGWLRRNYAELPRKDLAEAFNVRFGRDWSVEKVVGYLKRHGIRSGRDGRIEPGSAPWNKGRKGYKYGGRSPQTQFRPGNRPHTWRPVGSERINSGYRQRKISDTGDWSRDWVGVHILLWIERRGPIPAGHCIVFVDNDRSNVALDNLACVDRRELAYLNTKGFSRLPAELRPSAIALARLVVASRRTQEGARD